MVVRVGFLQGFNSALNGILRAQKQSFDTQAQLSSGRRIVTPADDPVASARVVQVNQEIARVRQYIDNADALENRLQLAENQLLQVNDIYIRMRELVISTGGAGNAQLQRQAAASEMETRLAELVDLANTRDVNGEYIFAGFQGGAIPFTQNANGQFEYQGDEGQRLVQVASTTQIAFSDSGKDIFMDVDAPANRFTVEANPVNTGGAAFIAGTVSDQALYDASYPTDYVISFLTPTSFEVRDEGGALIAGPAAYTAGNAIAFNGAEVTLTGAPAAGDSFLVNSSSKLDIFSAVNQFTQALNTLGDSPADLATLDSMRDDILISLRNAESSVGRVQAELGARQNTVESVRDLHTGIELINQEVLSELRDLDYAEAISRLSQETLALEAAQQTFSRVTSLNLFNFLR